jgi:signal transduction histidine kinase
MAASVKFTLHVSIGLPIDLVDEYGEPMKLLPINKTQLMEGFGSYESPELRRYIEAGMRLTLYTCVPVLFGLLGVQAALGALHLDLALRVALVLGVAWLLCSLALYRGWVKRTERVYMACACLAQLTLTSMAWLRVDQSPITIHTGYTALMFIALFCPLYPPLVLLLGLVTGAGECLRLGLAHASAGDIVTEAAMGTLVALHAAAATGLVRSLWLNREQTQQRLLAADRLSTLGQHTAGIAHELKTPLASAHMSAYALRELGEEMMASIGHPEVKEQDLRDIAQEWMQNIKGVFDGLERSSKFVTTLRQHTQQLHQDERQWFAPGDRLEAVSQLLRHLYNEQDVALHFMPVSQQTCVHGDPHKFDQLIINMVNNAVEACTQAGVEHCEVAILSRVKDNRMYVVVQDNGPGIPKPLREKIFEPLFTTKGSQGGTGLGLAMCRDITQGLFNGTLELVPTDEGARFEISLPLEELPPLAQPARQARKAFTPFPAASSPQQPARHGH